MLSNKYDIRIWQDDTYAVYEKGKWNNYLFKGTIEAVNAWLSLNEKGFDI